VRPTASLPQRKVWAVIFLFVRSCLTCGRGLARPETLRWAGIEGLPGLTFIEGLAHDLSEEHDEAEEPKPYFHELSPERAEVSRISRPAFTDAIGGSRGQQVGKLSRNALATDVVNAVHKLWKVSNSEAGD
jgi:hypothetical protein